MQVDQEPDNIEEELMGQAAGGSDDNNMAAAEPSGLPGKFVAREQVLLPNSPRLPR
jgi:hypothetical protein